jgi:sulfonate transport system substrate-binding protein
VLLGLLAMRVVAPATGTQTIRITTGSAVSSGKPVFTQLAAVITREGWLERELSKRGVRLEWVPIPGASTGPSINEGFANHSIDFASYGDLPSIIANAAGIETELIVPSGRGSDCYLLVPNDSVVRSIRDLKGKRIAVHRGRPWELPLSRLIDSVGLSYEDFTISNLNPEAGAAALAASKVDALFAIQGHALVERGVGKIIWSTAEAPPDWKMRAELWASKEFVRQNPELTQVVATAYVRAAYWASRQENFDELIKISARTGVSDSSVRKEYAARDFSLKDRWSPLFDEPVIEHYHRAIAYALDKHIIQKPIEFANAHDTQFVTAALKELDLVSYWQPWSSGPTTRAE